MLDYMIEEFLKTRVGIIIISIIWGLGLATLFKIGCDKPEGCKVIEFNGPPTDSHKYAWRYGSDTCHKLEPYIVDCK